METEQDPLADLLDGQIAASYRHQVGKAPAHYPTNTPTQPPTHYAYNPSPALPEVLAKEKILPEDSSKISTYSDLNRFLAGFKSAYWLISTAHMIIILKQTERITRKTIVGQGKHKEFNK